MRRVGVLFNPTSEVSSRKSTEAVQWMRAEGYDVCWHGSSQDCRDDPTVLKGVELLIAMGGDGTVLRAARLAFTDNIPVLAVALGHLSFMAEIGPEELRDGLEVLKSKNGWHDQRTLIYGELWRDGKKIDDFIALNEIVVARGDIGRIVTVEIEIDQAPLTTYHADGVLVSTATGSTAYALSAGGPIVDPRSRALLLVPIAAHLTNVPSMVLHEDTEITIRLHSRHNVGLAVDGRDNILLQYDDKITVRRSKKVCTFVRVKPENEFYSRLIRRLRRDV